jgi:hypothetical protein
MELAQASSTAWVHPPTATAHPTLAVARPGRPRQRHPDSEVTGVSTTEERATRRATLEAEKLTGWLIVDEGAEVAAGGNVRL